MFDGHELAGSSRSGRSRSRSGAGPPRITGSVVGVVLGEAMKLRKPNRHEREHRDAEHGGGGQDADASQRRRRRGAAARRRLGLTTRGAYGSAPHPRWSIGPWPAPSVPARSALRARRRRKAFARTVAASASRPSASPTAIAAASEHPVPWSLRVAILGRRAPWRPAAVTTTSGARAAVGAAPRGSGRLSRTTHGRPRRAQRAPRRRPSRRWIASAATSTPRRRAASRRFGVSDRGVGRAARRDRRRRRPSSIEQVPRRRDEHGVDDEAGEPALARRAARPRAPWRAARACRSSPRRPRGPR